MSGRGWRLLLGAVAAFAVAGCAPAERSSATGADRTPQRLISMAPSLTEVVFALGLGDRLVGDTEFCDYPPPARLLPKVGGYLDPSWEAVVALKPDLVLLLQDHAEAEQRLGELGIRSLRVDQSSVEGILASIASVADACGVGERGRQLVAGIRRRLDRVAAATAGRPQPRVLVVVGREAGTGRVTSVWVAGPHTFYDGVLRLAGGVNACAEGTAAYPEMSREGLLHVNPDVIVDVLPDLSAQGVDPAAARADWDACGELAAVRTGRVFVLAEDFAEIPGPRVADLVEAMARALHPEAW